MNIDWSKAPEGAEFYAYGLFRKVGGTWSESESCWKNSSRPESFFMDVHDYEPRPQEWPEETRIDTGEHYAEPRKNDQGKPMYNLLPPIAVDEMAKVLTFGAAKYAPNQWRHVPDAVSRYQAAALRHAFAMLSGEINDSESGLPHAAHLMCCAAFLVELTK